MHVIHLMAKKKSKMSGNSPIIKNVNSINTCTPKLYKIRHIYTLQFLFHFMKKRIKHVISRRKIFKKILEKKMALYEHCLRLIQ